MKVIEKARSKQKRQLEKYQICVEENARLRLQVAEERSRTFKLENEVTRLKGVESTYDKLLTESVEMENEVYELKKALNELFN